MPRYVLDTSVFIAGLRNPTGGSGELIRQWRAGQIDLVVSPHLLDEIAGVAARREHQDRITEQARNELLDQLRRHAELHADRTHLPRVSPDPDDDFLVQLGRDARADAIVSLDAKDVVSLELPDLRTMRPGDVLREARQQRQRMDRTTELRVQESQLDLGGDYDL